MGQLFQVAHPVKAVAGLLLQLSRPADTDLHLPKIGMAQGKILANEAHPAADLAIGVSRVGVGLNPR